MEFPEAAVVRSVPLVETLGKNHQPPPFANAGLDEDDLTWLDVTAKTRSLEYLNVVFT